MAFDLEHRLVFSVVPGKRTAEKVEALFEDSLSAYFRFYCHERMHQALDYRTPASV